MFSQLYLMLTMSGTLWWSLWSVRLLLLVGVFLIVSRLLKKTTRNSASGWRPSLARFREGLRKLPNVVRRRALIEFVAGLALLSVGYLWRDHQLVNNRFTYTDVYVMRKLSDMSYIVRPARMQPIKSDLCRG